MDCLKVGIVYIFLIHHSAQSVAQYQFKNTPVDTVCAAGSAEKCLVGFVKNTQTLGLCEGIQKSMDCIAEMGSECEGEIKNLLKLETLLAHVPLLFRKDLFMCPNLSLEKLNMAIPDEFYPSELMLHLDQLEEESKGCLFDVFSRGQEQSVMIELDDLDGNSINDFCQHLNKLDRKTAKGLKRCDEKFAEYFSGLNLQLTKFINILSIEDPKKCRGRDIVENVKSEL
ncbi:unnamed protein product [Owenia fusiformis]|uniref:Uncharacterized protein n=1 Tax=Owenia fusiformis TaxID=6347 RepID=A0A8J1U075_OWEFU|nr:unnamed protein product [Owenia fusiformis]